MAACNLNGGKIGMDGWLDLSLEKTNELELLTYVHMHRDLAGRL